MKLLAFCVFLFIVHESHAYLPVVCMHGIGGQSTDFDGMLASIQQYHPGTEAISLDVFNGDASFLSLHYQLPRIITAIQQLNYPKFHLVCHSQGSLICRLALMMADLNVDTYLSLSGPHMGQYGVIGGMEKFYPTITTEIAWTLLYNALAQDTFSAAAYWNDPHHQDMFLEWAWLATLNNLTYNAQSETYKNNLIQLENMVLFGSPEDGVIQPWQSAFFGFWDDNMNLINMTEQAIYINDYIGLQTLDKQGKLTQTIAPDVEHMDWVTNADVFEKYLLPWLT